MIDATVRHTFVIALDTATCTDLNRPFLTVDIRPDQSFGGSPVTRLNYNKTRRHARPGVQGRLPGTHRLDALIWPKQAFDPYPYPYLVLSTLAALQAPIIMMPQHRQAASDRLDIHENYKVSLKTDPEIMFLHQKIDAPLDKVSVHADDITGHH